MPPHTQTTRVWISKEREKSKQEHKCLMAFSKAGNTRKQKPHHPSLGSIITHPHFPFEIAFISVGK